MHTHALGLQALTGTHPFTPFQMTMLLTGTVIWFYLYIYLLYRSYKIKFVEMPAIVACANIGWELLWGFIFRSHHSVMVFISDGVAFIVDVFIFTNLIRFNRPYNANSFVRKNFTTICITGAIIWGIVLYTFKMQGYDTDAGGNTGYILNALIALFMIFQLGEVSTSLLSFRIAILKLIGDVLLGIFMYTLFADRPFTMAIVGICIFLDIVYVVLFYIAKYHPEFFEKFK